MPPTDTSTPPIPVDSIVSPSGIVPTARPAGPPDPARPSPPPPPPPIAIPEGEPAAAALALLHAVRPDAPSILEARIDRLNAELADQVEEYRLHTKGTLAEFIGHAGRRVKLRRSLEARAGRPAQTSAALEVLALIQAVRRWRPAEEIRRERARLVEGTRGELGRVEVQVQALAAAARRGDGFTLTPGDHGGLVTEHDEILRRLEGLLATRKGLRDRLARLDAQGDAGRAAAVRSAIEAAGGVDAVVAALAPSMTAEAAAELATVRRDIDGIAGQLTHIDDETRLAAELRERLAGLEARVPDIQWTIGEQRKAAAGAMVAAAIAGALPGVQALESAIGGKMPALAAALNAARADDADLVNVVAEMIEPRS